MSAANIYYTCGSLDWLSLSGSGGAKECTSCGQRFLLQSLLSCSGDSLLGECNRPETLADGGAVLEGFDTEGILDHVGDFGGEKEDGEANESAGTFAGV